MATATDDTERAYFLTCQDKKDERGKLVRRGCGVSEVTGDAMKAARGSFICPVCFAAEWPHHLSIQAPSTALVDTLLAEPTGEIPMDGPPPRPRRGQDDRQAPLL